ncbi:MAG: hypothetical protein ABJE63_17305 [Lentilitoribacter sp.]
MSANAQPHSLKQGTSTIGSEIFTSFERDIEDAIFETIVEDQSNNRADIKEAYKTQKPNFGKLNGSEHSVSSVPKKGLNIFSKDTPLERKSPFASQFILSVAICVFTIAAVLPIVWMLDREGAADQIANEMKSFLPDASVATGSIDTLPAIPEITNRSAQNSKILGKKNPVLQDKTSSLHAVGEGSVVKGSSEGSVIYFGAQD